MEQDLLIGHSVTSARDLRQVFRKIGAAGEREHSCLLTSFAETISFADSGNFLCSSATNLAR